MGTSGAGTASGQAPDGVTDLSTGSWIGALKRTVKAFKADKLAVWAAALTYFGVLSVFPALLVVVSVLGLIGQSATDSLLTNLQDVAPGPAQEIFSSAIRNLQGAGSASGVAFVIGLVGAIWASSGYVSELVSRLRERPRASRPAGRQARNPSACSSSATREWASMPSSVVSTRRVRASSSRSEGARRSR